MSKTLQPGTLTALVADMAGGSLVGATVGVWGFSTDAKPSPAALAVIEDLLAAGARVQVFDPDVDATMIGIDVMLDAYDAAREADALMILTESDEFNEVDLHKVREIMTSPVIVDVCGIFSLVDMEALGFSYSGSAGSPGTLAGLSPLRTEGQKNFSPPNGPAGSGLRMRLRRSSLRASGTLNNNVRVLNSRLRTAHEDAVLVETGCDFELQVGGLRAKRAFDLIVGTPLALAALPLIGLFALGIAFSFRCWPFFTQWRVGRNGERFRFLKIRSLPPNTPAYVHKFNLDTDTLPRLARFLRKQHLDELPQLLLVPLGKMSLVGPRPKMPDDKEPIEPTFGRLRTSVPQGCTGLWQIGEHAHLRVCDSAEYDYAYLHHGGVLFDMWILWRTALLLIGKNTPVSLKDDSSIPEWAQGRGYVDIETTMPSLEAIAA